MISAFDGLKAKKLILEDDEAKSVLVMAMRVEILKIVTKTFEDGLEDTDLYTLVGEALSLAAKDWEVMNRILEKVNAEA